MKSKGFLCTDGSGVILHGIDTESLSFLASHRDREMVSIWLEGQSVPDLSFLTPCQSVKK